LAGQQSLRTSREWLERPCHLRARLVCTWVSGGTRSFDRPLLWCAVECRVAIEELYRRSGYLSRDRVSAMAQSCTLVIYGDGRRSRRALGGSLVFLLLTLIVSAVRGFDASACIFILFWGSCSALSAASLLVTTHLELTTERFVARTAFRRLCYRWEDIERFGLCRIGPTTTVGFRFAGAFRQRRLDHRLNWLLTGYHDTIPDEFETHSRELLLLVSDWHMRFCKRDHSAAPGG
jgi:hypothetical protein